MQTNNLSDIFGKLYYINLSRDDQKENFFLEQISRTCLKSHCSRFEAVDGRTIDIDTIPSSIITENARHGIVRKTQKIYGISLTYGSLGCALSHKKIWDECANDNKPYFIFEDDILPVPKFNELFWKTLEHISVLDYDIVLLGYNEIRGFSKLNINNYIAKPSGLMTGLYSYIISNNGAKKIQKIFPLNKQIDSSISDNALLFNIYCSSKPLFHVSTKFGSKTQRSESCINMVQKNDPTWDKLFQ